MPQCPDCGDCGEWHDDEESMDAYVHWTSIIAVDLPDIGYVYFPGRPESLVAAGDTVIPVGMLN